jgi:3',5'-cyclic AMP phosphodiesterase CpdA
MTADARVVQLSDTHLAHADGVPPSLAWLLDWIAADPPGLVVITGDIVYVDPDDDADREFARDVLDALPCRWVAIPGNHDIGFFDEVAELARRRAAFVAAWGAERFAVELKGWRLVGINAYTLGDPEADEWFAGALRGAEHVAVFTHQPVDAEPVDGWEMPAAARLRFGELTAGAPVRVVATGHRHCAVVRDRPGGDVAGDAIHVWAPSTTLTGQNAYHGGDPTRGAVEYRFATDGSFTHHIVPAPA